MTIEVGARITESNYADIVPGTVCQRDGRGSSYRALENLWLWSAGDGGMMSGHNLQSYGTYTVTALEPEPVRLETPAQFKQRVRTVTYGASVHHGIDLAPVERALARFGADEEPELGVGMWLHRADNHLRGRLDRKSGVVFAVGNPNYPDGYGEWDGNRRWVRGAVREFPYSAKVVAMDDPDTTMYLDEQGPGHADEIAVLRGQVWVIGERGKRDHRWCEAFETTIATLGISGENVQITAEVTQAAEHQSGVMTGRVVHSHAEQNQMPAGAVYMWPSTGEFREGNGSWCWMQQTGQPAHGYGSYQTSRLFGPNTGRQSSELLTLWDGTGVMHIPVPSHEAMNLAPEGTQVQMWDGSRLIGHPYTKGPNGWNMAGTHYNHNPSAFFQEGDTHQWVFSFFPMQPAA